MESQLLNDIHEHINAEISLKTIDSVEKAIHYLENSYLYVRIKKNQKHYIKENCSIQEFLKKHCQDII